MTIPCRIRTIAGIPARSIISFSVRRLRANAEFEFSKAAHIFLSP